MKLYHIPGTCSLGIQALLEETGQSYELISVGGPNSPERAAYREINPKGKVPALDYGAERLLTEFPAVAAYIARSFQPALLGETAEQQARIVELLEYIVATAHMQGFARIRRPDRFSDLEADHPRIRQQGRVMFQECLDQIETMISADGYALGALSIADFALFYLAHWAADGEAATLGPRCRRHYERMRARPAVARILA